MTEEVSHENLRIFDFTKAESGVFLTLLERGPLSVSGVARQSQVPRTTVHAVLKRLHERGFVRKLPGNYLSRWKIKNFPKIKEKIREALEEIQEKQSKEPVKPEKEKLIGGIDASDIGIRIFRGASQVKSAYEQILSLHKTERVYFIQGNQSAEAGLRGIEDEYFYMFHEKLRKKGVILEGVIGERVLGLFEGMSIPLLRSHANRLIVSKFLPDEYLDFNLDIVVMRNIVALVSVERQIVVTIRFEPIVEAFLKITEGLAVLGRRVDLNTYIKELIEKKEKR